MAYATAEEAIKYGSIIYGRGNVKAVRRGNGFIYWPTNGVAMDAASSNESSDAAVITKIAREIAANKAMDKAAISAVRKLFPQLLSAVADGVEEEAQALGLEGEDEALDSFSSACANSLHASKEYWSGVKAKNAERTRARSTGVYQRVNGDNRSAAVAADAVEVNARRSESYSAFAGASRLSKEVAAREKL
jgi:hypothetical protein